MERRGPQPPHDILYLLRSKAFPHVFAWACRIGRKPRSFRFYVCDGDIKADFSRAKERFVRVMRQDHARIS